MIDNNIIIIVLVSFIAIISNVIFMVYNIYFWTKEECRNRIINVLYSQLCLFGQLGTFLTFAMILYRLEMIDVDWNKLLVFRYFQVMTTIYYWLLIGAAELLKNFRSSLYINLSYKNIYLPTLLTTMLVR